MTSLSGNNVDNVEELSDDPNSHDETANFLPAAVSANDTTPSHIQNMTSEENVRHKNKPPSVPRPVWKEHLFQHITTAAHACVLLYTILIVYFCFSGEFQFFTWHPFLLSIGWMFLMTEALLVMSKDSLLTGTLPKKVRVRLHWIFQAIAMTLIFIGFAIVFINKNNLNKSHFKSWHALFGFIAIVCTIPTSLDGILALYHGDLRNYIHPKISKFIHFASGAITYIFGGLALILSVYTKWFARQSNDNALIFMLGLILVLIPVIWTAWRPTLSSIERLKDILWEKRKA